MEFLARITATFSVTNVSALKIRFQRLFRADTFLDEQTLTNTRSCFGEDINDPIEARPYHIPIDPV